LTTRERDRDRYRDRERHYERDRYSSSRHSRDRKKYSGKDRRNCSRSRSLERKRYTNESHPIALPYQETYSAHSHSSKSESDTNYGLQGSTRKADYKTTSLGPDENLSRQK